ncbi:MAG: cytochrome P450 [Myxococcota bacterium]|nr:cytochrome P450 [Myxococcota bacterium]
MPNHAIRDSIQLLDGRWYQGVPFDDYAWMRANAPLYWDPIGEIWAVARHEDIMHVSKTPELFCSGKSSRPERDTWIPSMINFDDPHHKRRRNLVNRGFTPRRVEDHEENIRTICRELINAVCEKGSCEFVRDIAAPLPMAIIGDMLGVLPEDRSQLLEWSDDLVTGSGNDAPGVKERSAKAALGWIQYAQNVLKDRRANPERDDLISMLVHAELDGERLDDEAIIQESLLILVGGDETTRHVIVQGMEALIANPDQRQLLIDDPSRIPLAVEEMLRWVSPIKNMNRTATRDTELRGEKIREGDRMLLLYHSGNLDERAFDAPEEFRVLRDPNNHVAFGGYGTHFCLGASLARLELRIMFEELLRRLPDIEIAPGAELPLRRNNFIVGIEEMPVTFTPSAPAPSA